MSVNKSDISANFRPENRACINKPIQGTCIDIHGGPLDSVVADVNLYSLKEQMLDTVTSAGAGPTVYRDRLLGDMGVFQIDSDGAGVFNANLQGRIDPSGEWTTIHNFVAESGIATVIMNEMRVDVVSISGMTLNAWMTQ